MTKKSTKKEDWPIDSAAKSAPEQSWARRNKSGLQIAGMLLSATMVGGAFVAADYFPREHDGAIHDSLSQQLEPDARGFNASALVVDAGDAIVNLELPNCTIAGVTIDYKTLPDGQYSLTGFEYPEGNGLTLQFASEQDLARMLTGSMSGNPCGKLAIAAATQPRL